jgi:hypothetical protein
MPGLPHMPEGQEGISDAAEEGPLACAANVEYCWLRCCSPQSGQLNALTSSERRSSFSN